MKQFFILFFLAGLHLQAFAQTAADSSSIPLSFEWKMYAKDSASQKELFRRAKVWMAAYYRSANAVTQNSDAESGDISGHALYNMAWEGLSMMHWDGVVRYYVRIQVKDGKYKLTVSDFNHEVTALNPSPSVGLITTNVEYTGPAPWGNRGLMNRVYRDIQKRAISVAGDIKNSLQKAMDHGGEDGDW